MDGDDAKRLAELFDNHAAKVYRYLLRRVGNPATAEDLVSDTFLVAARRVDDIPPGNELPWLYNTARNILSNWQRRLIPEPVEKAFLEKHDSNTYGADISERLSLQEAWLKLSEADREVLRLAAWEGLSGKYLAVALGVSEGGAASALSRARARLASEVL